MKFREFSENVIKRGWTPIFEWCSTHRPVVLQYPTDTLTLVSVRNIRTGEYYPWNKMVEEAKSFNIPCARVWKFGAFEYQTAVHK